MKVSELTVEELKQIIKDYTQIAMDEALLDFFGDPEEGFEFKEEFITDMLASREKVKKGGRGIPAEQVRRELGL